MKIIISITVFLNIFFYTNLIAATVNCLNGECEFNNSFHYKYAKTYCLQTLVYENVETYYSNFIIIKTGEKCNVFETSDEK